MKKALKLTAAALAAISAMTCTGITSFADKLKTVDGTLYRYSDNGEVKGKFTGWAKTSKGRYCYKDGVKLKNKWIKDSKGRYRYLDKSGRMVTGWYEISRGGGKYSWFDENGYWDGNSYCSKYSDAVRFGDYVKIKVSRNEIICEPYSGNYSSHESVNSEKAKAYVTDNTEYELSIPLAVAEQLRTGDKLVVKAGVFHGEKVNGKYTYKLGVPSIGILTASKVLANTYAQKVREAMVDRFELFNSLLVLRNGRLKLDMMYDAYRLDTRVLDEDGDNFFLTDDAQMYLINGETKEITYGLFGGYNKLNEKTGKYAFRDGITEKALLALMKEKITSHREARYEDEHPKDGVYSDTDWLEWVGNMLYCWLDVTVVGIDRLPEAAAPTDDMYEEYIEEVTAEEEAEQPIPALYSDFITYDGGVYFANIENEPSWKGTTFTKSVYSPGVVYMQTDERYISKMRPLSASVLPKGTKLWWSKEYPQTVLLAEYGGRLIPYLKIVEG